jgi:hypothetical protein
LRKIKTQWRERFRIQPRLCPRSDIHAVRLAIDGKRRGCDVVAIKAGDFRRARAGLAHGKKTVHPSAVTSGRFMILCNYNAVTRVISSGSSVGNPALFNFWFGALPGPCVAENSIALLIAPLARLQSTGEFWPSAARREARLSQASSMIAPAIESSSRNGEVDGLADSFSFSIVFTNMLLCTKLFGEPSISHVGSTSSHHLQMTDK